MLSFARRWWLCSPHLETIATLASPYPSVALTREVVRTPDDDEIVLEYHIGAARKPLVVLLHGLEGCAQTHALRVLATHFKQLGWSIAAPHFRTCGGHANRQPRAYHAADADEVAWMVRDCHRRFAAPAVFVVGLSLGGCALIHALAKHTLPAQACATICAPFELAPCVRQIDATPNRQLYARYFLERLRPKIIAQAKQHPRLGATCDIKKLKRARTLRAFDSLYTAPVHGFANAASYYRAGSTTAHLARITKPLLCINSKNDPLVPFATVPRPADYPHITFCQPQQGGHAGFIGTPRDWLFTVIKNFFTAVLPQPAHA